MTVRIDRARPQGEERRDWNQFCEDVGIGQDQLARGDLLTLFEDPSSLRT